MTMSGNPNGRYFPKSLTIGKATIAVFLVNLCTISNGTRKICRIFVRDHFVSRWRKAFHILWDHDSTEPRSPALFPFVSFDVFPDSSDRCR